MSKEYPFYLYESSEYFQINLLASAGAVLISFTSSFGPNKVLHL